MRRWLWVALVLVALGVVGCESSSSEKTPTAKDKASESTSGKVKNTTTKKDETAPQKDGTKTSAKAGNTTFDKLTREAFNRNAVRLNLPLYWTGDLNKNAKVDPNEVVTLRFYPTNTVWSEGGAFSDAFKTAYATMQACEASGCAEKGQSADVEKQHTLLLQELDQGRPTLVYNDLTKLSADEKTFVKHMQNVAKLIDELYAEQNANTAHQKSVASLSPVNQSVFRRNRGLKCVGPKTESEAACQVIAGEKARVGTYPAALQEDEKFCEMLSKHPDSKKLLNPFTVVKGDASSLSAVPYTEAYATQMQAIAKELTAAISAVGKVKGEEALVAYLTAAKESFSSNNWEPADEAWSKMSAFNSRWYVRVGPDETYWEPCTQKAGFHLTFALINTDSIAWQKKLSPIRQEMEDRIAKLVGAPYTARKVAFKLPDFIDIVINAGDDRDPFGATIGQSLPNWGPVANEGRGRTVAMSNLYTDPDSLRIRRLQAKSLFDAKTAEQLADSAAPGLLSTILHEAAHNLGPAHEYKIDGKTADEIFGGPTATTFEELKAQCAALWYIALLQEKKLIDDALAQKSYVDNILWALGHISRGVYTATGRPRPYSHLAAIQVAFFMEKGAITFDPTKTAANGTDKGAFIIHLDKIPAAAEELMQQVGAIKASGNKAAAEAMIKKYVDGDMIPFAMIKERMLRYPKASFVYAYDL